MRIIKLTKEQLTELCFSCLHDKIKRTKTEQKRFDEGRRKLLEALKLEKVENELKLQHGCMLMTDRVKKGFKAVTSK